MGKNHSLNLDSDTMPDEPDTGMSMFDHTLQVEEFTKNDIFAKLSRDQIIKDIEKVEKDERKMAGLVKHCDDTL